MGAAAIVAGRSKQTRLTYEATIRRLTDTCIENIDAYLYPKGAA